MADELRPGDFVVWTPPTPEIAESIGVAPDWPGEVDEAGARHAFVKWFGDPRSSTATGAIDPAWLTIIDSAEFAKRTRDITDAPASDSTENE